MTQEAERNSAETYHRSKMQRDMILKILRERGCRITKQRQILLDIILENEYSCCKEIYYKAIQRDKNIGTATVYRMIKTLEDIGAIARNNMYKINCAGESPCEKNCRIELEDDTAIELTPEQWKQVLKQGLIACGYTQNQDVKCFHMDVQECPMEVRAK